MIDVFLKTLVLVRKCPNGYTDVLMFPVPPPNRVSEERIVVSYTVDKTVLRRHGYTQRPGKPNRRIRASGITHLFKGVRTAGTVVIDLSLTLDAKSGTVSSKLNSLKVNGVGFAGWELVGYDLDAVRQASQLRTAGKVLM